jgi:3-deoxy-7-phosphoheptulonate synthase
LGALFCLQKYNCTTFRVYDIKETTEVLRMLVVMNSHATEKDIQRVALMLEAKGFKPLVSHGEARTVVHAIGVVEIDQRDLELLQGVDEVIKLSTNYKLAARPSQGKDTVVEVNGVKFGDKYTGLIAGPCTIESYDQMDETAQELSESNVKIIRGGAFKPRTSPYAFQGLGEEGLKIIDKVGAKTGFIEDKLLEGFTQEEIDKLSIQLDRIYNNLISNL